MNRRDDLSAYVLISPFLLLFTVFLAYPVCVSVFISMKKVTVATDWFNVFNAMTPCGFENYRRLLTEDVEFWFSLLMTGYYAILTIPGGIVVSLVLAVLLSNRIRGVAVYRTAFFLPNVLDPLVVGMVWVIILAPQYGVLEVILRNVLGLPAGTVIVEQGFLGNPWTCLPVIAFVMVLKQAGFGMILFLTAIQNIPGDLYEAADLDGAGRWDSFCHITFPFVKPVILFLIITGMMNAMNAFTEIYALTNGQGGPTMTFLGTTVKAGNLAGFLLFKTFEQGQYGYAASMAFTLMGVALVVSWINMKVLGDEDS